MGEAARSVNPETSANWLMRSISRMIRPIVGFTVGRVSCSALVELVREIYIDEARRYLAKQTDGKVTYSALSLVSGMDGRAIKTVEQNKGRDYEASDVCSEAAILEMWHRDEAFKDPNTGESAELLIHGPGRTFQRLVQRAAGRAITSHTVLERLIDSGNVEVNDADTHVRLLDRRYMPITPSDVTAIESGSFAINRLGRAILHNSERDAETASWLQQDRWSTSIPVEAVPQVRAEIRELLSRHIAQFEDFLEDKETQPLDRPESSVGVGWYYWEDVPREDGNKHL